LEKAALVLEEPSPTDSQPPFKEGRLSFCTFVVRELIFRIFNSRTTNEIAWVWATRYPIRMLSLARKLLCGYFAGTLVLTAAATPHKTQNVFLITVDGFRWQEVFTGAEELLMNRENGGVTDTNRLIRNFWRKTPEERREALLPFFWSHIAAHGQIYGNSTKGSVAQVTNGKKFTYPGFNEMLTGFPDPRIDKNEKRNNPNVTVLEWLHQKRQFAHRIVGFANWDVHPYVLNAERSGIPVWTGFDTNLAARPGSRLELVQKMERDTTPYWHDMSFDSFYAYSAIEYVKENKPRVVWIAYGETDEWAHNGRYDMYLYAAHDVDRYIRELWESVQSLPQYKNKTTFIITCDHGRGSGPHDWQNHGAKIDGAENIWLAIIGPDTTPLGERTNASPIYQKQVAATIGALLCEDYNQAEPRAALPIEEALAR
jgi:hypothetical protein